MKKLEGKLALVTGGTSGIGLATAKRFIAEGASVLVTGNNAERLELARRELGGGAGVVDVIASDAGSRADLEKLGELLRHRDRRLDILFLNAGVLHFGPILELDEALLDQSLRLNFKGPWLAMKLLVPLMRQGGTIVATTSVNATIGMPGSSAYAASKAALRALVRVAAAELAPRGIRVNAVSPGPIATALRAKIGLPGDAVKSFDAELAHRTTLKRLGTPDEIARAVVFLASDDSTFMTGEELVIDGGMTTVGIN
jgi:NAD(P)-dependent dehydrogenase (short-subunit alcohol dehydrogenase family)